MIFNKRGSIDDFIPLLLVLFAFVIGVTFLIISSAQTKATQQASAALINEQLAAHDHLLHYLRTASSEGQDGADTIVASYLEGRLDDITPSLTSFFDPLYSVFDAQNWRAWRMQIYLMPEHTPVFNVRGKSGTNQGGLDRVLLTDATLPLPTQHYLQIELYKEGRGSAIQPLPAK